MGWKICDREVSGGRGGGKVKAKADGRGKS